MKTMIYTIIVNVMAVLIGYGTAMAEIAEASRPVSDTVWIVSTIVVTVMMANTMLFVYHKMIAR